MKLDKLKRNWEGLGEKDAFWAVMTSPTKINNKWVKKEFFDSGSSWINQLFSELNLAEKINFDSALDFGCGPGRLTQALAKRFKSVTGVDISSSMIEKANALNQFKDSCKYLVNNTDDLSQLPSNQFDFVLTFITLQHISPNYTLNYIKEFKRVIKDDGYIFFNLPTQPPYFLHLLLKVIGSRGVNLIRMIYYRKREVIEMHWIEEEKMREFFAENGLKVVKIEKDLGVGMKWKSNLYLLKK
jgi:ubiquinone/menaquinone biosynthesis C-methylase UbiE